MLTPLDIQNKEFTKGFRGYIEIEVDSFLDEVIADYEHVFKENLELKSKIDMLNEQIKHYGSMENTLQKTLVIAQTTAEDVVQAARRQGDSIIDESDRRAEKMIESARDQVINSKQEYERIRKEILMFKTKYKTLLNAQLETIDHYAEDDNVFGILEEMKANDALGSKRVPLSMEDVSMSKKAEESMVLSNQFREETKFTEEAKLREEVKMESIRPQQLNPQENDYSLSFEKKEEERSVFGDAFEEKESSFADSFLGQESAALDIYQGQEDDYGVNLQSNENTFAESIQQQGGAFAERLQRQKQQNNQESLYVENLQDNQRVNINKITPKEDSYEAVYSSMDQQIDSISKYAKKPVLD